MTAPLTWPSAYEVSEELGRGGMGVVYRARQVALNREVALKVILVGGHATEIDRERFLAEAKAIAALDHPGIVRIHDYGTWGELPYFAMEFCPGGTLARKLSGEPLPPSEAARLVEQVALAVQAAHEQGVVHRDLKPGNIFLASGDVPKVGDFGLARRVEGGGTLTQTGALIGTPAYMAPEQAQGKKKVGPAADVWALGVILYECLTGKPPFQGETTFDILHQVIHDEPPRPRQVHPAVPGDLEIICLKCLEKDPQHRYASAAELVDDLRLYLEGGAIRAGAGYRRRRALRWVKRHVLAVAVALAVVLALAAAVGVGLFLGNRPAGIDESASKPNQEQAKKEDRDRRWKETIRLLQQQLDEEEENLELSGKDKKTRRLTEEERKKRRVTIEKFKEVAVRQQQSGKAFEVLYYGVSACANKGCHGGDPPKKWIPNKDLLARCTEVEIWNTNDKHADAYNVLTKERGKRMEKILGYDVTDPKGKGRACLNCHAVVIDDPKVLKESKDIGFDIREGVTCMVCHGPHPEWVGPHGVFLTAAKFRPLSRREKEERYGMRDLWDPIKRAELCMSCHVGSIKEGKFVTHEMYAAGHPPLPSFEVATFSNEMPRHWQHLSEKSESIQKELGLKKGELEQTRLMLVGAAVGLRESMQLLAMDAAAAGKNNPTRKSRSAPDLAHFECAGCHAQRDRISAGYRIPRHWPGALAPLSAAYPDKPAPGTLWLPAPRDSPALLGQAAADVAESADRLAKAVDAVVPDARAARRLLAKIPDLYGKGQLLDYDSARQVAWAYEVMFNEVNGYRGGPASTRKTLAALDKELKLRLPRGRKKPIEDEQAESRQKRNNFDARKFESVLRQFPNTFEARK
jgi:hypothetical protein